MLTVYDARDALTLARAIDAMHASNSMAEAAGILGNEVPGAFESGVIDATRQRLKAGFIKTASSHFMLIDGCRRTDTARDMVYSYALPPNDDPGFGENLVLARLAINSAAGLAPSGVTRGANLVVAGYSAGACLALFIGSSLLAARPDLTVSVCMFNPPRPAIRTYRQRHTSVTCYRWHCVGDPIKFLPLHSDESPEAARLTDPLSIARLDEYVQMGFGAEFDDNANVSNLQPGDSGRFVANPATNLLGWGVGALNDPVVAHSLPELIRRLELFTNLPDFARANASLTSGRIPTSGEGLIARAAPEYVGPHSQRQDHNRGHRLEDVAIALMPPEIRPFLPKPGPVPRKPFYRQKLFGKWWLVYLGTPCFDAGSKAKAGKEASRLNEICARVSDDDLLAKDREALVEAIDYETKDFTTLVNE